MSTLPTTDRSIRAFLRNTRRTSPEISVAESSAPTATPVTLAQHALDKRAAAYSGPYTVDGKQVTSPSQFRMTKGFNDVAAGLRKANPGVPTDKGQIDHSAEINTIAAKVGADATRLLGGYPSASDLVKVTQALIDAGHLPSGKPENVVSRIKTMQWQYGIGIDCTDYAVPGAARAQGASVFVKPGNDYFTNPDPDQNPTLVRVPIALSKTGDVFCLTSPERGQPGHRTVIYSKAPCDPARATELGKAYPEAGPFLRAEGGKVQLFEVDSSFSAGAFGSAGGGVRRDTWLYNEGTKKWAQIAPNPLEPDGPRQFTESSTSGPYSENLKGIYRFKVSP